MTRTPYANLIAGELDNRTPGKVTGWMGFCGSGSKSLKVTLDLTGDFGKDIRGKIIQLRNTKPSEKRGKLSRKRLYMEGFSPVQQGIVGVITAGLPLGPWTEELAQKLMEENEFIWSDIGLESDEWMERRHECAERYQAHIKAQDFYYPYEVDQPYIEWYANSGRVVLELDPPQIKIFDIPRKEKSPKKLLEDAKRRIQIFGSLMVGMGKSLSK